MHCVDNLSSIIDVQSTVHALIFQLFKLSKYAVSCLNCYWQFVLFKAIRILNASKISGQWTLFPKFVIVCSDPTETEDTKNYKKKCILNYIYSDIVIFILHFTLQSEREQSEPIRHLKL